MINDVAIPKHPAGRENLGPVTSIHSSCRRFLQSAAATGIAGVSERLRASLPRNRPNVLMISTDQQFADAMSCRIGRQYLHTPNMDQLAARRVAFTRAYSANSLCMPSRASKRRRHR